MQHSAHNSDVLVLVGKLKCEYTIRAHSEQGACVAWWGSGASESSAPPLASLSIGGHCKETFHQQQIPFHCLSYALHQMMVKARVPRWPCHLSLLTKACVNSLLYGIYQMDQNNKSHKLQGRYPFFFSLYTSQDLHYYSHQSFVTLRMCFH